jgi:hypothetical protein
MTEDPRTDGHVGRHGTAVVNGPEDDDLDWLSIDWQRVEDDVRRLRQRIFTGLLEPGAVKAARRVLRGSRGSNAPGLPDRGTQVWAVNSRARNGHRAWAILRPAIPKVRRLLSIQLTHVSYGVPETDLGP